MVFLNEQDLESFSHVQGVSASDCLFALTAWPQPLISSCGETQLLVDKIDWVNYAHNRRVELMFSDIQGVEINLFRLRRQFANRALIDA